MKTRTEKTAGRGKRILAALLAAMLALLFSAGMLTGCGDAADRPDGTNENLPPEGNPSAGADGTPGKEESAFPATVTVKGVAMTMGKDAAPVLAALGEWKNYVATDSCAFVGQDKEYTYNGFVLMTYPDGETDRISSVILTSDAVTTGEGLYIGAPESEIEKTLGSDCTKESGSYLYRGENAQLLILASDGKITSIQYSAVFES